MIKPVKKIVIVGGGSAGWMTAAMLARAVPEKDIIVIESPDFPIVGVGESTLGGINGYCKFLGIDEKDFMEFTDASYKMSIKFTDFYEKDAGGFHYPFGKPYTEGFPDGMHAWFVKKHVYPNTPIDDFAKSFFPQAALYEQNKFSLNKYGEFDNYDPEWDVAYHFDATKFGLWLKEKYCLPRGVRLIADTVVDATVGDRGIESLHLESGGKIGADLFIDCTGFKSLLLGKFLKEPFTSYTDMLPNNRAWATRMPYKDQEAEMEPFTNSTALGNGWTWNIPSWKRLGTGYVYSDKYTTPEDAKEEFKQFLMSNKMVIPRTREEVDQLEFKDIPMRVGIHERTFVKNVVAIGLSAGFIEPLESNGLFSVHEFLFKLIKLFNRPAITQWDIDTYNAATHHMWNNFAEFVGMHYALSIRDDTEYWRANGSRVYSKGMPTNQPDTAVGFRSLMVDKMFNGKMSSDMAGVNWISVGCHYFMVDQTLFEQQIINHTDADVRNGAKIVYDVTEERKARWLAAAKNKPSLYRYLKENIYNKEETK
jgi:tryptophan halogenase